MTQQKIWNIKLEKSWRKTRNQEKKKEKGYAMKNKKDHSKKFNI